MVTLRTPRARRSVSLRRTQISRDRTQQARDIISLRTRQREFNAKKQKLAEEGFQIEEQPDGGIVAKEIRVYKKYETQNREKVLVGTRKYIKEAQYYDNKGQLTRIDDFNVKTGGSTRLDRQTFFVNTKDGFRQKTVKDYSSDGDLNIKETFLLIDGKYRRIERKKYYDDGSKTERYNPFTKKEVYQRDTRPKEKKVIETKPLVKSYVDKFGVIRKEGGTGYKESDYKAAIKSGDVGKSKLPSLKRTNFGRVGDKFYTNLSKEELLSGKLASDTIAREDKKRSRIIQGTATAYDVFDVVSGGKKYIDFASPGTYNAVASLTNVNIKKRQLNKSQQQTLESKPVLTLGKLLELTGKKVEAKADYKLFYDKKGNVIGVQDPFSKQSYSLPPTRREDISSYFNRKQLEKEYLTGGKAKLYEFVRGEVKQITERTTKDIFKDYLNKLGNLISIVENPRSSESRTQTAINLINDIGKGAGILSASARIFRGDEISIPEYKIYKKSVEDIFGIQEHYDLSQARLQKQYDKNLVSGTIQGFKEIGNTLKFSSKVASKSVYYVFRDIFGLIGLGLNGLKGGAKLAFDVNKGLVLDLYKTSKSLMSKKKVRKLYTDETLKALKPAISTGKNIERVFKNPDILGGILVVAMADMGPALRDKMIRDPSGGLAEIISLFIDSYVLSGVGAGLKFTGKISKAKYLRILGKVDPDLARATKKLVSLGDEFSAATKKIKRLDNITFDELAQNTKVRNALSKTVVDTKAVMYGSKIEFEIKIAYLQDYYKSTTGKKLSKTKVLDLYRDQMKKAGIADDIIDDLLGVPKDLDLIIEKKFVNKFIRKLQSKYEYIPELLQEALRKNIKDFRKFDFELGAIRKDKASVFSVLKKQQIDDLLKGLTENAETTAFKIEFLQNLYNKKINKKLLQSFDLSGSGLSSEALDFALDLHSSKEVAFTKQVLGFAIKQDIPLEKPIKVKFKSALKENLELTENLIKQRDSALTKLGKKFEKGFKKYGLNLNYNNFKKNLPKFLESAEIRKAEKFDFLVGKKPTNVNKKILETWYKGLDELNIGTSGLTTSRKAWDYNLRLTFIKDLLDLSKSASKTLNKFDGAIDALKQQKDIILYYSTGSKKLLKNILGFDLPGFKLKEKLSLAEQNKLLETIKEYEKALRKRYSAEEIRKLVKASESTLENKVNKIKAHIKTTLKKRRVGDIVDASKQQLVKRGIIDKKFVDLGKSVERDLALVKGFKTKRLQVTKQGIRYIAPSEQIKRRTAGAVSTIFETRRAKDIKKIYNNIVFLESVNQLELARKAKLTERSKLKRILNKIFDNNRKIKKNIKRFKELTKEITEDIFRKEKAISTKGVSETIDIKKVDYQSIAKGQARGTKKLKELGVDSGDLKRIKQKAINSYKNNVPQKKINGQIDDALTIQLKKKLKSRSISIKSISAISVIRNAILLSISRSISKSLSKSRARSLLRSLSKSISRSKSTSVSSSVSKSRSISRSISKSKSVSKSKSKSLSKSVSRSKSRSVSRSLSKSLSKSVSKSVSKSKSLSKSKKPPIKPRKIKIPRNWTDKLPRGYKRIVNGLVRVKGKTKVVRLNLPPKRAIKQMSKLVDNTTTRSFQLKIVGIKKVKDLKKINLKKFRLKKTPGSPVLKIVEKRKYAIDTTGEKIGLKIGRVLRTKPLSRLIKNTKRKKRAKKRKSVRTRVTRKKRRISKSRNNVRTKRVKRKPTKTRRFKIKRKTKSKKVTRRKPIQRRKKVTRRPKPRKRVVKRKTVKRTKKKSPTKKRRRRTRTGFESLF